MAAQILLAVALVVGIAVLFWYLLKVSAERIAVRYRHLAEGFQLELTQPEAKMAGFVRPEPFVHGMYRGREMSISAPGKGLQNTRQSETVLKLSLADKTLQLQVAEAGVLGGMRQRDSGQKDRWKSGDRDFDAALDVRTSDGVRLAMLFGPEVQRALLGLMKGSRRPSTCATASWRSRCSAWWPMSRPASSSSRQPSFCAILPKWWKTEHGRIRCAGCFAPDKWIPGP